ncbi:transporter substrate-binding domain-containing protein [Stutzerimonas stutzeri]|uniref:transporter substrate-binding domain-containing protein n=1 Tax=Stutzerimonas stutzeri TaxID=316 RepID=UPI0015E30D0A|nr:transporter substrate-binding domain-containing protein [Stutzerimonas stutzeri]
MRVLPFLVLLPALLGPVLASAQPLQATLPEYRILSSTETDSFESALLEVLGEALGQAVTITHQPDSANLRLGPVDAGPLYYQSVPAALTANEGGVADWQHLRNQPVCLVAASPYAQLVTQRFGAQPREYPSTAHALIGLKLGECRSVVDDQRLLAEIAKLPEWRRYDSLLAALPEGEQQLRISTPDAVLQARIDGLLAQWKEEGTLEELIRFWIDEVAFQAYVLADTLDCH